MPGSIVYDRTKTVVKRHVAPGKAVPLHPEAVAFAGHYGFDIDVLAAYRPTGKGRVERQVDIVRAHVLAGRAFCSLEEMDAAFAGWARDPPRPGAPHPQRGDRGAGARPITRRCGRCPAMPYLVAEQHLRRVGKDCLISFEASLYSVPARQVRPFQTGAGPGRGRPGRRSTRCPATAAACWPCTPARPRRGSFVVDEAHWDGLPDGHTRAVTAGGAGAASRRPASPAPRGQARAGAAGDAAGRAPGRGRAGGRAGR